MISSQSVLPALALTLLLTLPYTAQALNIEKTKQSTVQTAVQQSNRDPRIFFGLFASVTPYPCTGSSSGSAGTCYTSYNCDGKGGTADGTCFESFSVCCVIEAKSCGSEINDVIGTIRNPTYPGSFDGPGTCSYTVNKQSGYCQLKVEFIDVSLAAPVAGECGNDTLTITGDPVTTPTLCGSLTGDPTMIIPMSSVSSVDVSFAIANDTSKWDLKVTQVSCTDADLAPAGCLTYDTETSGTLKSWNYQSGVGHLINGQRYTHCLKYTAGFCDVAFTDNGFEMGDGAVTIGSIMNTGSEFTATYFNFTGPYSFSVTTPEDNVDYAAGYELAYEMLAC